MTRATPFHLGKEYKIWNVIPLKALSIYEQFWDKVEMLIIC
jgi:hypothetical protein